ncbi:MAG: POTRA domain-containing protein, partial [bacterium]
MTGDPSGRISSSGLNSNDMLKFLCVSLIFLCVSPILLPSSAASGADDVIIQGVEVRGLHSMEREEFLSLLAIRAGQKLDADAIRVGIKRAFLTMKFNNITISSKEEDPSQIVVDVDEKYVISDIQVKGNNLLSRNDVRKNFPILENQYLYPEDLDGAIEVLRNNLVDMGYPHIQIQGTISYKERKRRAKITLVVQEGEPLMIRKIVVRGVDNPEEVERILLKLKVYAGDVYDKRRLKGRLDKLDAY